MEPTQPSQKDTVRTIFIVIGICAALFLIAFFALRTPSVPSEETPVIPDGMDSSVDTEDMSTPSTQKTPLPEGAMIMLNGETKIAKFSRRYDTSRPITMRGTDANGKEVLVIEDVFHKYTDFNQLLAPGEYTLRMYDGETGALLTSTAGTDSELIKVK